MLNPSLSLSLVVDNRLCHRQALAFIPINIKVSFNLLFNEKFLSGLGRFSVINGTDFCLVDDRSLVIFQLCGHGLFSGSIEGSLSVDRLG